jgi:hypothetical protein
MLINVTKKSTAFPIDEKYMISYLRADQVLDAPVIGALIDRACMSLVQFTNGYHASSQTYDLWYDDDEISLGQEIIFPVRPVQTINSVTYYDLNRNATDWTLTDDNQNYLFIPGDTSFELNRSLVVPAPPSQHRTLQVNVTAGPTSIGTVPADIKIGLEQLVVYYFENRGDITSDIPASIQTLWNPYIRFSVGGGRKAGQGDYAYGW